MAKPNYAFQKRQRELAKKQKKEEKRQRRVESPAQESSESPMGGAIDESVATSTSEGDPGPIGEG